MAVGERETSGAGARAGGCEGKGKVLITGGAGFLGSQLAFALHAKGHELVLLDDLSSGQRDNLLRHGVDLDDAGGREVTVDLSSKLVLGDVTDAAIVAEALQGVSYVFHF